MVWLCLLIRVLLQVSAQIVQDVDLVGEENRKRGEFRAGQGVVRTQLAETMGGVLVQKEELRVVTGDTG